jgi:excisionase family DNA binding protein
MNRSNEMTLKEAAKRIGRSESTLRHAIRHKTLQATMYGRDWFVTEEALDEYVRGAKARRPDLWSDDNA